jgi:hypothetical protein
LYHFLSALHVCPSQFSVLVSGEMYVWGVACPPHHHSPGGRGGPPLQSLSALAGEWAPRGPNTATWGVGIPLPHSQSYAFSSVRACARAHLHRCTGASAIIHILIACGIKSMHATLLMPLHWPTAALKCLHVPWRRVCCMGRLYSIRGMHHIIILLGLWAIIIWSRLR